MKIYLDDERESPAGWIRTRTPDETIVTLASHEGQITHLSLDHDLGLPDPDNGYKVLLWLEEQVAVHGYAPPENITVHSANAGARPKMELAIQSIRRHARRA